jgi:serine/threonine protein phosphatase PrpC
MPFAERQIGSGQDYAMCGEVEHLQMRFAFVADGHGSSKCIDFIRSLDPATIASHPDPPSYVFYQMQDIGDTYHSGFAFTFARVFNRESGALIQVWNVGDAETHVHVNKELVYQTPAHNFTNEDEIKRTKPFIETIHPVTAPFPVSDREVELVLSPEGLFKTGETLVLSMAYGHNNMTGFEPSFWEQEVPHADKIHIVCGSDGFFDMLVTDLHHPVEVLANQAAERWAQQWSYFDGKRQCMTNYGGGYDDVAVAII